jgi:hypothetical protein
VWCLDYYFLEPTERVSPKILSPQPSRIPRLSSQRIINARLIRDQVIAEFHMSSPDASFEFQEVPSYLALHNLSLPSITSESDSEPTSQPTSPISASTQHLSPVSVMKVTSPSSFSIHLQPVTTLALTDTEQTRQIPFISSTLERVIISILMSPLKDLAPPTSLPG